MWEGGGGRDGGARGKLGKRGSGGVTGGIWGSGVQGSLRGVGQGSPWTSGAWQERTREGAGLGRAAGCPGAFWGSFFAPGRPAGRATSAWEGKRPKLAAWRRRGGSQAFIPVNFGFRSWRLVDRGAAERLALEPGPWRCRWQPWAGEDSALPAR